MEIYAAEGPNLATRHERQRDFRPKPHENKASGRVSAYPQDSSCIIVCAQIVCAQIEWSVDQDGWSHDNVEQ